MTLNEKIEKARHGRQGFAYILLKSRFRKGLTAEKAAEKIGFPLDVYMQWENGEEIPAKGLQTAILSEFERLSDVYDEDLPEK